MENGIIAPNSSFSLSVIDNQYHRVDLFLSAHFSHYSRTFFKKLIDTNLVQINGVVIKKPSAPLREIGRAHV